MLPLLGMLGKVATVGSSLMSLAGGSQEAAGVKSQAASRARLAAQQREAAEFEAAQLETNAIQTVAASQRAAMEERRQATLATSRMLAVAAASGAGASDPTVINMMARTAGEGAYRAATAMWDGEDKARRMRDEAAVARYTGESRARLSEDESSALYDQSRSMRTANIASLFGSAARGAAALIR